MYEQYMTSIDSNYIERYLGRKQGKTQKNIVKKEEEIIKGGIKPRNKLN